MTIRFPATRILASCIALVGLVFTASWVLAQASDQPTAAPAVDPNVLAAAAVPFITWFVRLIIDKIPDAFIITLRNRWMPVLVPIGAVLIKSVVDGQLDLTQGALIGLAGVGLHQFGKALKIVPSSSGGIIRSDAEADAAKAGGAS